MEDSSYLEFQKKKEQEYDELCKHCGACCGIYEGDPCKHLVKADDGTYRCEIYENRFGMRKTISGREFLCVPLRNILLKSWAHSWNCGYKKLLR